MTGHVLSVTSATVPPESEAAIVEAFRAVTSQLPHMVLHTSLVRGEGNDWRIVTLWRSRDQLEEYRRSVQTPAAIKIFQDAGARPTVAVLEVVHEAATQ
jgi:heme-degrading monooxygenase HmoA